jgi:hypothetical protein
MSSLSPRIAFINPQTSFVPQAPTSSLDVGWLSLGVDCGKRRFPEITASGTKQRILPPDILSTVQLGNSGNAYIQRPPSTSSIDRMNKQIEVERATLQKLRALETSRPVEATLDQLTTEREQENVYNVKFHQRHVPTPINRNPSKPEIQLGAFRKPHYLASLKPESQRIVELQTLMGLPVPLDPSAEGRQAPIDTELREKTTPLQQPKPLIPAPPKKESTSVPAPPAIPLQRSLKLQSAETKSEVPRRKAGWRKRYRQVKELIEQERIRIHLVQDEISRLREGQTDEGWAKTAR